MIYPYIVVKNGKWYKYGENVPDDSDNVSEARENQNYTKTEIHQMPVKELRELATEQGIDGAEYLNGSDIKKLLIEKMEL